jgi:hypothetical protein
MSLIVKRHVVGTHPAMMDAVLGIERALVVGHRNWRLNPRRQILGINQRRASVWVMLIKLRKGSMDKRGLQLGHSGQERFISIMQNIKLFIAILIDALL